MIVSGIQRKGKGTQGEETGTILDEEERWLLCLTGTNFNQRIDDG